MVLVRFQARPQIVSHCSGNSNNEVSVGKRPLNLPKCENSSAVEHHLAKVRVAGSIPVFRSNRFGCRVTIRHSPFNVIVNIDNRRIEIYLCRYRIGVITPDFQSGDAGSIPAICSKLKVMETILLKMKERKPEKMNFYEFNQNNSGGHMDYNDKLTHRVFIEAEDYRSANSIAEDLGIYFNGVDNGSDCECCGDRWYEGTELTFPHQTGSFNDEEAKAIVNKVGGTIVPTKYKSTRKEVRFDIVFETVEDYAKYMANQWNYFKNDKAEARVFYKNGDILEVYTDKK